MPQVAITSALSLLGILSLAFGVFLVLAGLKVIEIDKITVYPGRSTVVAGALLLILGIVALVPEIRGMRSIQTVTIPPTITSSPTSTLTPASTETPSPTATHTPVATETSSPTKTPTPTPPTTLEMMQVPAGEFIVGSSFNPSLPFFPHHTVYLDEFYVDKYEVTNVQYAECVQAGVCTPPKDFSSDTREEYYSDVAKYGNFPVIHVTWEDANTFCQWRGTRLPTEAEWEKAASYDPSDGKTASYPWGEDKPEPLLANYNSSDTINVNKLEDGQSFLGAYQMAGNVSEWVYDFFDPTYYENSPKRNPQGPNSPINELNERVIRGGSWRSIKHAELWTFWRFHYPSSITQNDIGFRCTSDSLIQ